VSIPAVVVTHNYSITILIIQHRTNSLTYNYNAVCLNKQANNTTGAAAHAVTKLAVSWLDVVGSQRRAVIRDMRIGGLTVEVVELQSVLANNLAVAIRLEYG
jgi:hypothetical protein